MTLRFARSIGSPRGLLGGIGLLAVASCGDVSSGRGQGGPRDGGASMGGGEQDLAMSIGTDVDLAMATTPPPDLAMSQPRDLAASFRPSGVWQLLQSVSIYVP